MCIPRQSRPPNMQLRQRSCRWCFRAKRTQRHHRLYRVALQREDHRGRELAGRKGTQKRARKRALLGPRWFREIQRKCFGMNGGDDEARTRDLCRDRLARFCSTVCSTTLAQGRRQLSPGLRWRFAAVEGEQVAVDEGAAPPGILPAHLADQISVLARNDGSSGLAALPSPRTNDSRHAFWKECRRTPECSAQVMSARASSDSEPSQSTRPGKAGGADPFRYSLPGNRFCSTSNPEGEPWAETNQE